MRKIGLVADDIYSLVPPIVGADSGPGTLIAGCLPYIQ